MSLKLNSLDPDYEYWKIGGKIDLATSIPGFFDSRIAGFDGSFSSYYWLPDKVTIGAALDPGITVYKVIDINQVGGELQGMSTIALNLYESVIPEKTYNIIGTVLIILYMISRILYLQELRVQISTCLLRLTVIMP